MVGHYQIFPYKFVEAKVAEIDAFVKGDSMEKESTVVDKIQNDFGIAPKRFTYSYPAISRNDWKRVEIPGTRKRRSQPLIYMHPKHQVGYRVIVGALDFVETFWGAILISPDGRIIHTWLLSTDHLPTSEAKAEQKNLYGVHVFPDGSVIFNMQEKGGGIVKVGPCGREIWNSPGSFHHAVSPTEDGHFWTVQGTQYAFDQEYAKLSTDTGEIVEVINMADVRTKNPGARIWDLSKHLWTPMEKVLAEGNLTHSNDIDPLPANLVSKFGQFESGDLLISNAVTNLVFVMSPRTLAVKWWRIGLWDYPHDPDWQQDGRITVYDNSGRKPRASNIIIIDPKTMEHDTLIDGNKYQFRSFINGRHQRTDFGTWMITISTQGRILEINDDGKMVFFFINKYDDDERAALHLSEAWRFSENYFEHDFWNSCAEKRNSPNDNIL